MKQTTLCYLERDGQYLMLHRVKKEHDENHDKWIGVGGKFEARESPEDCVRREVLEETGVTCGAVRYLASQPWPFPASLMIGCAAEALTETITRDPAELEDALWISREDLLAAQSGERPGLMPARKGSIAHFLLTNWLADRLN